MLKGSTETVVLEYAKLRKSLILLRSLTHETRLKIIDMLSEEGPLNVTDIFIKLRVEQSVASQHLAALRKYDIVHTARNGKNIIYQLNQARIDELKDLIEQLSTVQ